MVYPLSEGTDTPELVLPPASLWRDIDFLRLWVGQSVSLFGSLIGSFAIQMIAIVLLEATPGQVAILRILGTLPAILIGLFAGVWADRLRRRPIMIISDLGRAILLVAIPVAGWLGILSMYQLYFTVFVAATMAIFFDVAYHAYLPALIRRDQLVEGNSKLQATSSVAEVAGFSVSGVLIQALTAPIAVLIDATSFLVSAIALAMIRKPESAPAEHAEKPNAWHEIKDGLRIVASHPILRAFAGAACISSTFGSLTFGVYFIYLARELSLEPHVMGLLFALGGISSLGGAVIAERLSERLGVGKTILLSITLSSAAMFFIPIAAGPFLFIVVSLAMHQLLGDGASVVYAITETSFVQATTSSEQMGRVTASVRFLGWVGVLLGSTASGILGESIGVRPTLIIGSFGMLLAIVLIASSPVRSVRNLPTSPSTG